jgi:hypothetical protein
MAQQVLTRPDVAAAPYDVELGALDVLEPTAVFAHFDGSAAGSAFLPCVTYYTQDGKVFARAFPADDVAAGASADVSWFPGLSTTPSGVAPAGAGDLVLIAEQVLLGAAGSISFASIPQTYRHLLVFASVGRSAGSTVSGTLVLTWNSGVATYDYRSYENYVELASDTTASATAILIPELVPRVFAVPSGYFAEVVFTFPYYSRSDRVPNVSWVGSAGGNGPCIYTGFGDAGNGPAGAQTLGPITEIDYAVTGTTSNLFVAGSRMSLYGVV